MPRSNTLLRFSFRLEIKLSTHSQPFGFYIRRGSFIKLAISNIAWYQDKPIKDFLKLVQPLGCEGLELAASIIWEEPANAPKNSVREIRRIVEDAGMKVTGLQALTFNRPDLRLFGPGSNPDKVLDYFKLQMDLCKDLGGEVLVYGSPKSRNRGDVPHEEAYRIAVKFFGNVGEEAGKRGVYFCIEPLGKDETDFINSLAEAEKLIEDSGRPDGLGLHIDCKALINEREYMAGYVKKSFGKAKHVHLNDPGLTAPGSTGFDHHLIKEQLDGSGYARYLSIEMRRKKDDIEGNIVSAINYAKSIYFS